MARRFLLAFLLISSISLAARPGVMPDGDLSQDPEARGFAEMMFGQGRLAWEDGDMAGALGQFERAAATWPADATYIYYAGLVQIRMGHPDRAVGMISKALPPATSRIAEWRIRSDLGAAHYMNGQPAEAEKELRAAASLEPADGITHFYLGLALLDLDRPAEAAKEFAAAGRADQGLAADSRYYSGVAALRQGDAVAARTDFEQVISAETTAGTPGHGPGSSDRAIEGVSAERPAPDLVEKSRDFLGRSTTGAARPPAVGLRLTLAWEYDSNPAIVSEDIKPFLSPSEPSGNDDRLALALRAEWHPFYDWHGLSGGLLFNGYRSGYNDLKALNQSTPQGLVQLAWGHDARGYVNGPLGYVRVPAIDNSPVAVVFQGGSSYTWLDGKSFGRSHVAALGAAVPWGSVTATQLDLVYEDRTYFGDLEGRSNEALTARLSEYLYLGRPERYLRAGYSYADEDADGTVVSGRLERRAYDENEKGWFVDASLPLPKGLGLFLEGSRSKIRYDVPFPVTSFFSLPRKDRQWKAAATLVAPIGAHLYLTGRYARQRRDSEIEPLGYARRITSFGVTWHW